jgi:hypothetical protein
VDQSRGSPRKRADSGPVETPRRLGPVQRRIWRAFIANPDRDLSTDDLIRWAFPRHRGPIEHKHRVSVLRATYAVAEVVRYGWRTRAYFRAKPSQPLPSASSVAPNAPESPLKSDANAQQP